MNPQRKFVALGRSQQNVTEQVVLVIQKGFDDAPAVNVHGLNVQICATPFGPDETLLGRWYVLNLPHSMIEDVTLRNNYIANFDTIGEANAIMTTTEFVWGCGQFICAEQAPLNIEFKPSTSRNIKKGGAIIVLLVADQISGVIDDWDSSAQLLGFTST